MQQTWNGSPKTKKKKQHEIGGQLNVVKWGQTLEGIQDFSGSLARLMLISNCVNVGFRFLHTHTGRSLWPLEMQTGKKATNLNICLLQHAPSLPHTHTHTLTKRNQGGRNETLVKRSSAISISCCWNSVKVEQAEAAGHPLGEKHRMWAKRHGEPAPEALDKLVATFQPKLDN